MPIKDLQKDAGARLKRAGIIRLGVKKRSNRTGREYPVETEHFVLRSAPDVAAIYGDTPTRLNIYLPFNEVGRNLIAWHQNWVAGGLLCRGDGEQIEYAVDPRTGENVIRDGQATTSGTFDGIKMTAGHPVKCPGMAHDLYPRCQNCSPNALLIVLIREIPRLAYYQIATSSIHNIVNLTGQMRWVRENIGRLQGVPFILERRADKISTPSGNGGKRVRREKYLLHLEPDPEWVKKMLAEMHRRALPGATQAPAQLPSGEVVTGEFADEVEIVGFDEQPIWEQVESLHQAEMREHLERRTPEQKQRDEALVVDHGGGRDKLFKTDVPRGTSDDIAESVAPGNGSGRPYTWPAKFVQAVIDENLAENAKRAVAMLNESGMTPESAVSEVTAALRGDDK